MSQSLAHNVLHLVFSTRDRYPFISRDVSEDLNGYIAGVLRRIECSPIMVGSVEDHVHILFVLSKNRPLKDVVREVKSGSSRWLKGRGGNFEKFQWQGGYSAFSVSQSNVGAVVKYIRGQEGHHRSLSFKDELKKLLTRHGFDFDEDYLWD